jgi:hypothetical protein
VRGKGIAIELRLHNSQSLVVFSLSSAGGEGWGEEAIFVASLIQRLWGEGRVQLHRYRLVAASVHPTLRLPIPAAALSTCSTSA